MLKMSLSPPGQEPLIVERFLRGAFCPGHLITGVLPVKAGASEGRAAPGSSLPFCGLCPSLPPGALLVLPPSALATCPGAHSSFTSSTRCCSPQVSILLSHSQSAARKLGLIILGLVHVNVPFLPQERKKLQSPVVTPHCLWLLPGVDPSLGGWGPHRGKFLQDSSACAYGEGPLILGPQRTDILH